MRYTVIDNHGHHKGTQTLTDAMAGRLEDRGYQLIPVDAEVEVRLIGAGR
jgi:hypothetical protein